MKINLNQMGIVLSVALGLLFCAFGSRQSAISSPSNTSSDSSVESVQVRLSEILILTPHHFDRAEVAEAQRKANEVRDSIQRGTAFADAARASSQGFNAAFGGDIGCFAKGDLDPRIANLVFQMKVGDVSDVILTKKGFLILQVTSRDPKSCHDSDLELLSQEVTDDIRPYLEKLVEHVRREWYALMPSTARPPEMRQGNVTIEFSILRDGAVANERVISTSGAAELDTAALIAIRKASPFSMLPNTIKPLRLDLRLRFQYNPSKIHGQS